MDIIREILEFFERGAVLEDAEVAEDDGAFIPVEFFLELNA